MNAGNILWHDEWYAQTRWHIEDVQAAAEQQGRPMSDKEAAAWWNQNEQAFHEMLVAHGNEMLQMMLSL